MSNEATRNLSREKIQQILASIGSQKTDDSNKTEAAEYNWLQPHYFSSDQLKELDKFAAKVAQACAEKFAQLYNGDFNVTITSTTQHFADEFTTSDNAQSDYYLAFGTGQNQLFGLVGMPGQTAIVWASQLLGDTKSVENSGRDLSQLEQSLLFDIAFSVVKALSDSCDNYDLHPSSEIVRGQMPIKLEDTEELCKITFNVKKSDSENPTEAYFLILCDKLKPIVGQNIQSSKEFSAEDIAKSMLGYVYKLPVSITTQLASAVLTFEEAMSLQADDILLLDKKVNEPVELIVKGRTVLYGRPAKSEGKNAVVITKLCGIK
jgi:flagellar motor switch protein FliM